MRKILLLSCIPACITLGFAQPINKLNDMSICAEVNKVNPERNQNEFKDLILFTSDSLMEFDRVHIEKGKEGVLMLLNHDQYFRLIDATLDACLNEPKQTLGFMIYSIYYSVRKTLLPNDQILLNGD